MTVAQRLNELGIELATPRSPQANYVSAVRTGNLVFLSGTGPYLPDGGLVTGKVGGELTVEQGYAAAAVGFRYGNPNSSSTTGCGAPTARSGVQITPAQPGAFTAGHYIPIATITDFNNPVYVGAGGPTTGPTISANVLFSIMGGPAHDPRGCEFARKYDIPVRIVIAPKGADLNPDLMTAAFEAEGVMVNSDVYNDLPSDVGWNRIADDMEASVDMDDFARDRTTQWR